ncbi:MAG: dihydrolipoyl dehydrogenase [Limnochordia bacterium]|nr:dihydrolipoyl dehydrogenase [Limnochordia bacterium]
MSEQIDLLVVGGGPAGYSAAIRARHLGKSVVVIEKSSIGGTCLNRGCIPTKALLESAHFYASLASAKTHGVSLDVQDLDYGQVVQTKDQVVRRMVEGLKFLLEKKEIRIIDGEARFLSSTEIQVGDETFRPDHILVATGTVPFVLPNLAIDGERVVDSDQLLDRASLPKSLVIVGGGVIGCEFATIFASYGVQVTIVELMPQILPPEDAEISQTLTREFKKRKIKVLTGAKVEKLRHESDHVVVEVEQKGKAVEIETELVLVSVGRKPVLPEGFPAEVDPRGYIPVNGQFQTSVPHIYAAGDVIGGIQLAHLAFEEGWSAVNNMAGKPARNEWFVPGCVYTTPEIASVGLTEAKAKEQFGEVVTAKYSLKGNARAAIAGDDSGFVKFVASADGVVLGVHIIGPQATELISGAVLGLEQGMTLQQWAEVVYPHPTVSESIKEAVLSGLGIGLHSL